MPLRLSVVEADGGFRIASAGELEGSFEFVFSTREEAEQTALDIARALAEVLPTGVIGKPRVILPDGTEITPDD